jgi:hypothetical protein
VMTAEEVSGSQRVINGPSPWNRDMKLSVHYEQADGYQNGGEAHAECHDEREPEANPVKRHDVSRRPGVGVLPAKDRFSQRMVGPYGERVDASGRVRSDAREGHQAL